MENCPLYLKQYQDIYVKDPKKAKMEWFKNARYGLFMHYGLYSLLHKNEWVMYNECIPVHTYKTLQNMFTAHNFDADKITDMALKAGMKYITITTCHHEGFCLWDSQIEPFNAVNSPCKRDLIKELSEACDKKGLGFFAYYTFMLNWRHPYYVDRSVFDNARPDYKEPQPEYLYKKKEDFAHYIDYIERMMDELLSKYKITGIWLDLIAAWYKMGAEYIPIEDIYARLRKKHPDTLIAWKQGATGTEDFASCEQTFHDQAEGIRGRMGEEAAQRAHIGFEKNKGKHNEVCATLQEGAWSFSPFCGVKSAEEMYQLLGHAHEHNANLLLNVGPMADGSIHPVLYDRLMDIKKLIDQRGMPDTGRIYTHENDQKTPN